MTKRDIEEPDPDALDQALKKIRDGKALQDLETEEALAVISYATRSDSIDPVEIAEAAREGRERVAEETIKAMNENNDED